MPAIATSAAALPTSASAAGQADTDLTAAWSAVSNAGAGAANPDAGSAWGGVAGGGAVATQPVANAQAGVDDVSAAWDGSAIVSGGGATAPVVDAGNAWNVPANTVVPAADTVTDAWSSGIGSTVEAGGALGAPARDASIPIRAGGASPVAGVAGIAAPSGQSTANSELAPLLAVLAKTATGSQIVNALRQQNITISLVPTAVFRQTHSADTLAVFDSGTNTITLQRDQVLADPVRTALTFAHEATHALDDGRIDSTISAAQATATSAAAFAQAQFEVHMTAEARAYRNEAETTIELGLDPRTSIGLTPAVDPATGGVRDFATTWRAVAATRSYNPDGRTGTPRDFAS